MAFETEGFCVVRGPDLLWGGDIRQFHPPAGRFGGVIGGPPCQTFSSLANLVRAKGYEPRFRYLIPELERIVAEAGPAWFLMENVPAAPEPVVTGYGMTSFVLDNSMLDAGDGYGEEQERKRRFSFGLCGVLSPPNLRDRWITPAALLLPRRAGPPVTSSDGAGSVARREGHMTAHVDGVPGTRNVAVTAAHSGKGRPKAGHLIVYRWARMLELQGLPPDFLADAPFTVEGKRKAVANGAPLPMGRAIARAVKATLEAKERAS